MKLLDFNLDFGVNGAPLVVSGDDAKRNQILNLLNTPTGANRINLDFGVDLEDELQEPASPQTMDRVFMRLVESVRRFIPNMSLDVARSYIIPLGNGEYAITLYLDGTPLVVKLFGDRNV